MQSRLVPSPVVTRGPTPVMDAAEVADLLAEVLPEIEGMSVMAVTPGRLDLRVRPEVQVLRPGGTVSGPTLFAYVDVGAFLVINAHRGRTLSTTLVTSSLSFLEAVTPCELSIVVNAVRIGRRTAVCEARVEDPLGRPVAVATLHLAFSGRVNQGAADATSSVS